jgi:hypothetical protein
MDFVEDTGVGKSSYIESAGHLSDLIALAELNSARSEGVGTIFDLAMDALLATAPSGNSKQDTRLYTNGMDFVEDTGVGKSSYTQPSDCGHICDLIALAELNSARSGDYTIWADFPN